MEKQRWEGSEKRREEERREEKWRSEKRKSRRKEDAGARKGNKGATHCVFPMICGSGGLKSRLAKAAGAEPSGQMRDEKLHAVVARSTCRSQKCKKLTVSVHFWKLRCQKSARCVGAKQISKSKCTNHTRIGTLLEVEMSKVYAAVARSTFPSQKPGSEHFWKLRRRKSARRCGAQHIFPSQNVKSTRCSDQDVEKVYAAVARSTFPSQNVQNTPGSEHFWKLRRRQSARRCGAKHIFPSQNVKSTRCSDHFWTFRCRFAWPAQRVS